MCMAVLMAYACSQFFAPKCCIGSAMCYVSFTHCEFSTAHSTSLYNSSTSHQPHVLYSCVRSMCQHMRGSCKCYFQNHARNGVSCANQQHSLSGHKYPHWLCCRIGSRGCQHVAHQHGVFIASNAANTLSKHGADAALGHLNV